MLIKDFLLEPQKGNCGGAIQLPARRAGTQLGRCIVALRLSLLRSALSFLFERASQRGLSSSSSYNLFTRPRLRKATASSQEEMNPCTGGSSCLRLEPG